MAHPLNYWQSRAEQQANARFIESEGFVKWLNREYDKSVSAIHKDIYATLRTIAQENELSLYEAKQLMNAKELKGFRLTLDEFLEKAKGEITPSINRELNNAARRVKISKLQAMELQLRAQADRLLSKEQKGLFGQLKKTYEKQYLGVIYDLQTILGYKTIQKLEPRKLEIILNRPWSVSGQNFSEAIWGRKDKLIGQLQSELTQQMIRGASPDAAIQALSDKFEVSRSAAGRLVMTETAAIVSFADKDAFAELHVEKYEILATLDTRTSPICRNLDGEVFDMSDYQPGVTAPPFHPWCRSTTVPWFDDLPDEEMRASRNPKTGEYELMPGKMKYSEWEKQFVVEGVGSETPTNRVQQPISVMIPTVATVAEAMRALIQEAKFSEVSDSLSRIDDEVFIKNSNQLIKLEKKYGAIEHMDVRFSADAKVLLQDDRAIAIVHQELLDDGVTYTRELSLNSDVFSDPARIREIQARSQKAGFTMATSEEYADLYTITHEYGHILQDRITQAPYRKAVEEYKAKFGVLEELRVKAQHRSTVQEKIEAMRKLSELNEEAGYAKRKIESIFIRGTNDEVERVNAEIVEITKDLMRKEMKELADQEELSILHYQSDYSKSSPFEFFAEAFANAECGEPNLLGKGMKLWLERNGYGIH